jgi:propionyl-CoA:succinyl-CoA transferase
MKQCSFPILSAEEAAAMIQNGQTIGFSAFTSAGAAKAVPVALAERAKAEHAAGHPFKVGVLTGASTGPTIDQVISRVDIATGGDG